MWGCDNIDREPVAQLAPRQFYIDVDSRSRGVDSERRSAADHSERGHALVVEDGLTVHLHDHLVAVEAVLEVNAQHIPPPTYDISV